MKTYPAFQKAYVDAFPLALRINNPGYVPYSESISYHGQEMVSVSGYCVFQTPLYGLIAFAKRLIRIRNLYHTSKADHLIRRHDTQYEPEHDKAVLYVKSQCRVYGVTGTRTDSHYAEVMFHYIQHRIGFPPFTRRCINRAVEMAHYF